MFYSFAEQGAGSDIIGSGSEEGMGEGSSQQMSPGLSTDMLTALAKAGEDSIRQGSGKDDDVIDVTDDISKTNRGWPKKFRLPKFPPAVAESLERQDKRLVSKERSAIKNGLVTALFDHITKYTW